MQPHRYTRLHSLFDDFSNCFNDADAVVITPVYEAGEQPIEGALHTDLVSGLKTRGHRLAHAAEGPEDLPALVNELAEPGDFVICLGAGNITQWAYALPEQLEALQKEGA
jgi:UDP-N-acetylmuramate--alanine ligase